VTASSEQTNQSDSDKTPDRLHIAMVVRSFSERGGLELYAHRTVEGLLKHGHRVTVICEEADSRFEHDKMQKIFFEKADKKARKAVRIQHHFLAATKAVKDNGPFDIVHSQHLPMEGADVVSFHNHTAARLVKVGQNWEQLLAKAKMLYSTAYKRRYLQDEILCRAPVLMFPAAVMRDDFRQTYNLDQTHDLRSYVVANPGANFPKETNESSGEDEQMVGRASSARLAGSDAGSGDAGSGDTGQASAPFTFLFVGKGYRKKGLDILLSACRELKAQETQFRLLIAGLKAKPLDRLRLSLLGLSSQVQYLGFRKDMHAVYAQAQATILPSRIEPFGMAPVQGMLLGLVPIVSKVTGVSEVLSDGVDALILQDHLSAVELSQLMQKLITQPGLRHSLSLKARNTADMLTWDRTVEATLQGYRISLTKQSATK
jgi:glycosyltransferase involved in cell wall biosynthesis